MAERLQGRFTRGVMKSPESSLTGVLRDFHLPEGRFHHRFAASEVRAALLHQAITGYRHGVLAPDRGAVRQQLLRRRRHLRAGGLDVSRRN